MFGDTSSMLMLGGIALACFLLLRRSGRMLAKSRSHDVSPKDVGKLLGERGRENALADAPPAILRWEVEMHQTARDLKAEIDTKLACLQALTISARQEAARLEAAIARAESFGLPGGEDALAAIERLGEFSSGEYPGALARVIDQLPRHKPAPEPPHADIGKLASRGHSPAQIAERLQIPVADVELSLSIAGER